MKSTKLYKINQKFAQHKNIPIHFAAKQLAETKKAIYLFGNSVNSWIPKSVIKGTKPTDEEVSVPDDHKMLKRNKTAQPTKKKAKQVTFKDSGKPAIKITFPFDRTTVSQVKTIPGRKFHNEGRNNKYWTAPRSVEAIEKLQEFGFEIDPKLKQHLAESKIDINELDTDINIPGLGGNLYPFQKKGVSFIEARNGRALVADEMGLGKTVQALAWLQKHPEKRPAIIVCPSSLKLNWRREALKWMNNPDIQILSGTSANQPIIGDILIINYHILKDWANRLSDIKAQVLIGDEIHYIKNNKAKRTKAYKKIAKGIPHHIPMTGTPIVNAPVEIINAVRLVDKSVIPNVWHFKQRYCDAKHNGFGWDFSGASNTKELHDKLSSTVMIRRRKKDVLKDLPDKIRSFVPMELTNEREYQQAETDFINYVQGKVEKELEEEVREKLGDEMFGNIEINQQRLQELKREKARKVSGAETLVQIEELKQLAVKGKMKQAVGWIENFLESGEKLVVFCTHKFAVNELMEKFRKQAVKIDGSVSGADRDRAVEHFQNDKRVRLFVGNVQAAGVGLTLTAASTVAFLELPWTPGDVKQAEDRVHRIGQDDSVNIYYLLAEGTIEERIARLIDKKRKILDAVLDGEETQEESLLSELMSEYKQLKL